jgi:uncharacterized protein (TIGR03067 family)
MKKIAILLFAGIALAASPDATKEEVKKELDRLEGTWETVEMIRDGKAREDAKDDTVTFDGDKMTIKTKTGEHTGTCKLDPSKKPKSIDITPNDGPEKGNVHLGIYSLEGDSLKICFVQPENARPTSLDAKAGSGAAFVSLKRKK